MQPIVTPDEMAAIDRAAPEPVDVLIARAGSAVAAVARQLLRGRYGKRVVVVAGKGNNGNDGRDAAAKLARRGVRVELLDAGATTTVPACDLVIDAAYGTGFHGDYVAPDPRGAPVLAVDIPSGVDGLTGEPAEGAVAADATVTFAALKPGLVLQPGRTRAGRITLVDIGLDVTSARAHVVEAVDVAGRLPTRPAVAHKWQAAVWVVGGSPGMAGAPTLATRGAQRAGAGYVRVSTPGTLAHGPVEAVALELPSAGWAATVVDDIERVRAVVVGPGLPADDTNEREVRELVAAVRTPVVVDGTGLTALGQGWRAPQGAAVVLTPHDGEYARLAGHKPAADRFAAARELAAATGAIVLLKGPTTIVANPAGDALVSVAGDARLATAGTGDVLSGIIGALLAQDVEPFAAAALGAWLHGRAGSLGAARGLVAGDVPDLLPAVFAELEHPTDGPHLARS